MTKILARLALLAIPALYFFSMSFVHVKAASGLFFTAHNHHPTVALASVDVILMVAAIAAAVFVGFLIIGGIFWLYDLAFPGNGKKS